MSGKILEYQTTIVGNPWKNWCFLKLITEEGVEGFGEASLNGFARTVEVSISELSDCFVGKSVFDINKITYQMLTGVYSDGGQIHRSAIAAVDAACWDIIGKVNNRPIWELWGGKVRDQIPLYANGWYQADRNPESFSRSALDALKKGYHALKFDPFGDTHVETNTKELRLSLDIIKSVRDTVPPEIELMIEGHCRFDVSTSLMIANVLGDYGITWFEEPVSFRNKAGLVEIARNSPVPIATGENFTSFIEFNELCSGTQNLVLQPDVMNLGGLKAARQVCELGESLDIPVAPHDAQGPLCKALCLQLAAISNSVRTQEDFESFNPEWTQELASPIDKRDGLVAIPDLPGLGRTLRWEHLKEYPYDPRATLALYESGWEQRKGRR